MDTNNPISQIEVEVKFQGGQQECDGIVGWFEENGFDVQRKVPFHRVHVYFDDHDRLRSTGSRLRCVIAPEHWCRYDFKADDPNGRGETLEVSSKAPQPIPLPEAVSRLAASLAESPARTSLLAVKDSARVILVMTGTHQKFIAIKADLKMEISWDVLVPFDPGLAGGIEIGTLDNQPIFCESIEECRQFGGVDIELLWSGLLSFEVVSPRVTLSEIEIELLVGGRKNFDACIEELDATLGLARSGSSKLEMALVALKTL
jgi:hypothetical protein